MRLTCPTCDAQYEVPDEVIPQDGRDVQCSNCGDTWFHNHPDNPPANSNATAEPEPAPQDSVPAAIEQPVSEPGTEGLQVGRDDDNSAQEAQYPHQQGIASGVSDILRQEAEREAHLRAAETAEPLESQPDLGLDDMPGDEPGLRAREARDRMARVRSESPTAPEPDANTGSRRELLPDIEDINSSLRASDDGASSHAAVGPVHADTPQKSRSGFVRGFMLVLIIGVVLVLVYANAPPIAKAVPQVESMLDAYVAVIDQARLWLDARLGEHVTKPVE